MMQSGLPDQTDIFKRGENGYHTYRIPALCVTKKGTFPGPAAYSDLCVAADSAIGCLYERGAENAYEGIAFARCSLDWLTEEEDEK
ncbi:MAG: sialidase family protein [Planctomycetota bacterium]